jgi:hypothetical protein
MRKIDFIGQTLVMIAGLIVAVITMVDSQNLIFLLVVQLVLAGWQLISCGVSLIFKGPLFKKKLVHFVVAIGYLITLTLSGNLNVAGNMFNWYFTVPVCALAIYYYLLSYKSAFVIRRDRGSFLPNLSF